MSTPKNTPKHNSPTPPKYRWRQESSYEKEIREKQRNEHNHLSSKDRNFLWRTPSPFVTPKKNTPRRKLFNSKSKKSRKSIKRLNLGNSRRIKRKSPRTRKKLNWGPPIRRKRKSPRSRKKINWGSPQRRKK